MDAVRSEQETLRNYVQDIEEVAATLQADGQTCAARQAKFEELLERFEGTQEPIHQQMVQVMRSFMAGLFVGEGKFEPIRDNLDLERWFRLPKSHERRIYGHRHAGIRIVLEGPTLVHALDCPCGTSRAVHGGRAPPLSNGPRAAVPNASAEPPQDREEGTLQEETAVTSGRLGAALSRITGVLALSRTVVLFLAGAHLVASRGPAPGLRQCRS
jgi:hypothetical protein